MSTSLATFCNSNEVFEDLFPKVNKQIQLNILLRKWEDKQRRTKKYKYCICQVKNGPFYN